MLTVLSLRACSGRGALSRHARSTLSSVAKVRKIIGPMAAVIRSVARCVGYLVEMKHTLDKRSKMLLLHEKMEPSIYLHQPHEDVEAKNQNAKECGNFQVANFGGSYSSGSDKPSIYDGNSPHLESGRGK